jgi:hypothetical protein
VSGVAITVCTPLLGLDFYYYRQKLPIRSRAAWMLPGALALYCAAQTFDTLSNASNAPYKVIVGEIPKRREVRRGRGSFLYLAYARDASGLPRLLGFSSDADIVIQEHQTYRVGYLDDPQVFYDQGTAGSYFQVVDVIDPETNESYYHFDTRDHPVQVAVYSIDILFLLFAGAAVSRMAANRPDLEDDFENYHDDRRAGGSHGPEITSLNI